jgi:sphingomyelin phosphodiesterase acid-like 3
MDEMRLLEPEGNAAASGSEVALKQAAATNQAVAIKMVSSISPVDGNIPSFTIAKVNPATAVLEDYQVVKASNQTGVDTTWTTEYEYAKAYHQTEFSAAALKTLIAGFAADKEARTDASQAYIRNYFVGDMSRELSPFWPEYVCALNHLSAKSFAACVCAAK